VRSIVETYDPARDVVSIVLESELDIRAPNWDPSGRSLLVNSAGRLYRLPLDQPRLELVDTGSAVRCNNDHGISPDGKTLVISNNYDDSGDLSSEIFLLSVQGGELRRISPMAPSWWHGWSPDGRTVSYVASRDERRTIDVYTLSLDGGSERRLTSGEGHCDGPDFSADGSQIYYNCDRDGHAQIWVMAADGSDQRKLFEDEQVNWFPHPSPDGREIVYLAYKAGTKGHPAMTPVTLMLCDPKGGNRRRVREFIGGQNSINVPSWAPDGHAFAYVRYEP